MAENCHALYGYPHFAPLVRPRSSRATHDERTEPEMDLEALETSFDLVAPRGDELMDEFTDDCSRPRPR
jgi:hypothetical protein